MNPSTSLGTRSTVGSANPSPPVRQAGNIGSLLMIRGVCRRKVPSGGAQVKSKCRCRDTLLTLPNQPLKRVICDIGGGTRPPHDQPPLIQHQTEVPADNPPVIREAFPADLLGTPAFAHGVDELDAIRVDDAEHGRGG